MDTSSIILGKDKSTAQRVIAFISIIIVYFFYCYNFMLGTFVRPTLTSSIAEGGYGFSLAQASSIFAIMSFATIPGTLFFGWLTTRIGKKRTLMIIAIMIALLTSLPLVDPSQLILWRIARFVTGLALGGVFGTAQPLTMDMFPTKLRGSLAAILTSMFSVAMIFGGFIYGLFGDENWRLLVMTAAIPPAIGALCILIFVPDDKQLAIENLKKAKESKEKRVSYLAMYSGKYLWIGLGVILLSGMNFSAYSGFSNNATTYLTKTLGYSAVVAGSIYSLQGVGQLIGYNFWGFLADRFGRKFPLIGMFLCAVFVFIYSKLGLNQATMFTIVSFLLGLSIGFSGGWGAYYTELFPKRFSGLSTGISFNGGRIISTFALPMIASVAATSVGIKGIFYIVMGIFILGSILWFFLPETLNREREE